MRYFKIGLAAILLCYSYVSIAQTCNVSISPASATICAGGSISLTASGVDSTYAWGPAGGLNKTSGSNVTASPSATTTYTIAGMTKNGCLATKTIVVTVNPNPVANFTFAPNNQCASQVVQLTNTSTGTGLSYAWNFNDPNSGQSNISTTLNPSHTFSSAIGNASQNFSINLAVTDKNGCTNSVTKTVTVKQKPQGVLSDPINNFRFCGNTGAAFDTLYDASNPTINSSYLINWGDGSSNSSFSSPPSGIAHTFPTGIYSITYTVTGTNGCVDVSNYQLYNITNPQIGAGIPANTQGCGPITVCFPINNFSTNDSSTIYTVDFGDGSNVVIFKHPPPDSVCHTYSITSCGYPSNQFIFKIQAKNVCDSSDGQFAPIRVYTKPVAAFSINPNPGCINNAITFTNNTSAGFNSSCSSSAVYTWDFGDGSSIITVTSNSSQTHAYTNPGTYNVILTSKNSCGTTSANNPVCIQSPPIPSFSINPNTGCAPLLAVAKNTTTGFGCSSLSYDWSIDPTSGWTYQSGTDTSKNPSFNFTQAGTYTVTLSVTNVCGTFDTTQTIIIKSKPIVTINAISPVCGGTTVNPSAVYNNGGGTISSYSWTFTDGNPASSNSQNPGAVAYSSPGTYTITASATNECGTTTSNTPVIINPVPTANAGSDQTICSGATITLSGSETGGTPTFTYAWTPATGLVNPTSTSTSANPSTTTTYVLTVTDVNGCTGSDQVIINVNPSPVVTVNANASICQGQSISLVASGASTYTWSPGVGLSATTGTSVNANPSTTQTYTVTGKSSNNCTANNSVVVTVNPLPIIAVTPNAPTICIGNNTSLAASGADTYSWTPSIGLDLTTGSTVTASPTVTTTYTITGTSNNCSTATTVVVAVVALPVVTASATNYTICNGQSTTLTGAGAISYTWNPVSGLSAGTGSSIIANPTITTTYTLTGVSGTNCQGTDTVVIHVNPLPVIDVNSPSVCKGASVLLTASGATTYTWSPNTGLSATTGANVTANPTVTPTYTITGTITATGCVNTTTAIVTVNPLPVVDAGVAQSFCKKDTSITLINGTPSGGVWSGNGVSGSNFDPNTAGVGTWTLTYIFKDNNGCEDSAKTEASVITPTKAVAGTGFGICVDASAVDLNSLNPMPAGGTWSGNGVTGSLFSPAGLNGQQILTYSIGTGTCATSDTIQVMVNPRPAITVNSPAYCIGNSAILTANGATTYTWNPNAGLNATTGASVTANPTVTTTYTITGTITATGCVNAANAVVAVNPLPVVDAGAAQSFCKKDTSIALINGTPSGGAWNGNGVSGSNFNPNTAGVGTWTLTYIFKDNNGCEDSAKTEASVITPTKAIAGTGFGICVDASAVNLNSLNPTPAGGTWSGNGVTDSLFSPAGLNGQQILTYSIGTGTCATSDTIQVMVNPLPAITVNSPAYCIGNSATLTASGATTYTWSPNAGLSAITGASVTANATITTTYIITGTITATGCVNAANAVVTVNPLPVVDAGATQSFCKKDTSIALVNGAPMGGAWSGNGVSGSSFNPNAAGVGTWTLTYIYTDNNGCEDSAKTKASVITPTPAVAGTGFGICVDASAVNLNSLNPTPAGGTWSGNGVTDSLFSPAGLNGRQILTYSIGTGTCATSDTIQVMVNPLPVITVNSPSYCMGNSAVLTANGADTYTWSPIINLSAVTGSSVTANPTLTTTYTVTGAITATGCVSTANGTVTVFPLPNVGAGAALSFCKKDTNIALINGTPSGGTWSGSGVSGSNFNPNTAGVGTSTLTYIYTDNNGCEDSAKTKATVITPTPAVAGTGFGICVNASAVNLNSLHPTPAGGTWSGKGVTDTLFSPEGLNGLQILTYSIGTGTCATSDTIQVMVNPLPVVVVNSPSICIGSSVTLSASGATIYNWSPSAGLSAIIGSNVTASPASTTAYIVTGIITATGCVNTATADVTVNPLPVVNAGSDILLCNQPIPYTLTGYTPTTGGTGVWKGVSVTTNGIITPADTGNFIFTYTFTDLNGCINSDTISARIVNPQFANAGTGFNICIYESSVDLKTLNATPAGGTWSGTGVTGTTFNPKVSGPGNFILTYTFGNGTCLTTDTIHVTVSPQPDVNFSVVQNTLCAGQSSIFNNLSQGLGSSLWNFGDGTTSTQFNPSHIYTSPGQYTVSLTGASAKSGCLDTATYTFQIYQPPISSFDSGFVIGCDPFTLRFDNKSSFGTSYLWNFGNGDTSTQLNPVHTFTPPGIYNVSLIVSGNGGCADTLNAPGMIKVNPSPTASFTYQTLTNLPNTATVNFTNNSSNAIWYLWNFGDGSTSNSSDDNFLHIYAKADSFYVTLIDTNQFGCADTTYQWVDATFKKSLNVPNALTPLSGPPDDRVFQPKGIGMKSYHIWVYDTWGTTILWQSTLLDDKGSPVESWDGYYNGVLMPQDVYVWKVEASFLDGTTNWEKKYPNGDLSKTGTVTLLR